MSKELAENIVVGMRLHFNRISKPDEWEVVAVDRETVGLRRLDTGQVNYKYPRKYLVEPEWEDGDPHPL